MWVCVCVGSYSLVFVCLCAHPILFLSLTHTHIHSLIHPTPPLSHTQHIHTRTQHTRLTHKAHKQSTRMHSCPNNTCLSHMPLTPLPATHTPNSYGNECMVPVLPQCCSAVSSWLGCALTPQMSSGSCGIVAIMSFVGITMRNQHYSSAECN